MAVNAEHSSFYLEKALDCTRKLNTRQFHDMEILTNDVLFKGNFWIILTNTCLELYPCKRSVESCGSVPFAFTHSEMSGASKNRVPSRHNNPASQQHSLACLIKVLVSNQLGKRGPSFPTGGL